MALLIDLFGYLSVLVHGLVIAAQSMALGGAVFLVFLARPFADAVPDGHGLARRTGRIAGWAAVALVTLELVKLAMQAAVLTDTLGVAPATTLGANYAVAGLVKMAAAAALAGCLLGGRAGTAPLLGLVAVAVGSATLTRAAPDPQAASGPLSPVLGGEGWGEGPTVERLPPSRTDPTPTAPRWGTRGHSPRREGSMNPTRPQRSPL